MPRRAHKKSRNGCIECKRRHVKCDERRPTCVTCTTAERHCEYSDVPVASKTKKSLVKSTPLAQSPVVTASPDTSVGQPDDQLVDQPANLLHIELFHHLSTDLLSSLHLDAVSFGLQFDSILSYCMSAPYLMNEMLALSAFHLSILRPQRQDFYRSHAHNLQTHGLSIFNSTKPDVNAETCGSIFLFSSFLGFHLLCDALVFHGTDFEIFFDNLIHSIQLHRGIRTVAGMSMHLLSQTNLTPMLHAGKNLATPCKDLGEECKELLRLITQAKLGQSITETYKQTIEYLQSVLGLSKEKNSKAAAYQVIPWIVIVPSEYIDLLTLRRPEALVILAHYAAILHDYRDSWSLGDSGRFMIQSINAYLGPEWEEWLKYPNRVLADTSFPQSDRII